MPNNKSPNSKFKTQKFWPLGFWHWSLRRGFTLIEILIVVSIIGVLTGVSSVSYTKSQGKTRDSQRENDLQTIKSALNLYYQQNSKYPAACTSHAPDTGCYSTDAQPWIPDLSPFISNQPKDPAQVSQNIFGTMLASIFKFALVTPIYAEGGGGGCSSQAAAIANITGPGPYSISTVTMVCNGTGYTSASDPYVIFSGCSDGIPAHQVIGHAVKSGNTVDHIVVDQIGSGYTCSPSVNIEPPPGGGPTPTPTPTAGPTPRPTPPPPSGCSTASSVDYYYCYSTNTARNRYKIWARLENNSDSEVSTNSTATCYDASPPANFNYCVESE